MTMTLVGQQMVVRLQTIQTFIFKVQIHKQILQLEQKCITRLQAQPMMVLTMDQM